MSTSRALKHLVHRQKVVPLTSTRCRGYAAWAATHFHSLLPICPRNVSKLHLKSSAADQGSRCYSSGSEKPVVLTDPERPDLFYHLLEPPTHISRTLPVYGVSFLHTLPSSSQSSRAESHRIIGYLPAVVSSDQEAAAGLNDFTENPRFREILHEAIKEGLREGVDDIQNNEARQLFQGWMHIHDDRNIPPLGRIGDPDDIIATVLVENGKLLADTYQPMPAYRICTSDGVLKLTEGLAGKLKEVLMRQS